MPVDPFNVVAADYFAGDDMMGLWDLSSGAVDNPFSLMGGGYDMLGAALGAAAADLANRGLPANVHALAQHPSVKNAVRVDAARAVAANAAKSQAMKQALAQQMPGGTDRGREQALPLDSGVTIAAAASSTITASPQRAFRAERLVIDPGGATGVAGGLTAGTIWLLSNFFIGADFQFLSTGGSIPASVFHPQSVGTRLKGTTAVPGIQIAIGVTNSDTTAHRFIGALLGPSLD